jgi:multiple sugar transport system permease protein/raffinose/stachyose/melibiose transport system permease protein
MRSNDRPARLAYVLLTGPALVIYAVVIVAPILYSLVLSFTDWAGVGLPHFVGLTNYAAMFEDPVFWHALRNNGLIVLVSLLGQIPLGFFLAYVFYRRLVPFAGFFESIIFFPSLLSPVVVGILFAVVFSPTGLIASLIAHVLGLPQFELSAFYGKDTAIIPYLIVILWMFTGIYMVIFLANLQKTPSDLIEAAVLDGANEWEIMTQVILPNQIPVFLTTSIYAIAGSLKSFELLWVMTGGGPSYYSSVAGMYMIQNTFTYYKYGFGSAIAVVIIAISILLILALTGIASGVSKKYAAGE